MNDPNDLHPEGTRLGHYVLGKALGKGTFGKVKLASHTLTNEKVAQPACDWLEAENWLKSYEVGGTGPGSGRPTLRYKINPKIFDLKNIPNQEGEVFND